MAGTRVGELYAELGLDDKLDAKLQRAKANFKSEARSMDAEAKLGLDTGKLESGLSGAKSDAKSTVGEIDQMSPQLDGSQIGDGLTDGLADATGSLTAAGGGAGGAIMAGVTAAIVGGGALLLGELDKVFARDAGRAELGASLALPPEMTKELGRQAGEVWAEGWGENEEEVSQSMRSYLINIGGLGTMTEDEFQAANIKALAFAKTFDQDVGAGIYTVGKMIKNGLVKDANEGFDLLTMAMSRTDASLHGELLETLDEYGANFRQLGLTGPQALGMIEASVRNGGRNLDLAADSLREYHDRVLEDSPAMREAFALLGVDGQMMHDKMVEGGPAAREALQETITKLNETADPELRNRIGQELFGPKWFDNGAAAITAMDPAKTALQNIAGASDDTVRALQTQGLEWGAVQREMQTKFSDWITNTGLPAAKSFHDAIVGPGGVTEGLLEVKDKGLDPVWGSLQTMFGWLGDVIERWEEFVGILVDLPNTIADAPGNLLERVLDFEIPGIPGFDTGGVVPGPRGAPRLIMAHAGETILPTHKQGGGGMGGGTNITVNGYDRAPMSIVNEIEHRQSMAVAGLGRI